MVKSTSPPANGFVATVRNAYNPLGFSKGYNFVFFIVFSLGFIGFNAYSMKQVNIDTGFCGPEGDAPPGECFHYRGGVPRIGMFMHLAAILPAGVLACFQFLPIIRHKAIMVHRVLGYIILLMSLVGGIGGLLISRNAFGGGLDSQTAAGTLFIVFTGALIMAYVNIKRLQIDQHRAWMLRAWFYGGAIVTTRIIIFTSAAILTRIGGFYVARSCEWLDFTVEDRDRMLELYPECSTWANGENPDQMAVVAAKWTTPSSAAEVAASLAVPFGMGVWLALVVHAVGVEIYLHLTPAEGKRLRMVSYQRQLAAGMRHPGSAGLTSDRLGDESWWSPGPPPGGDEYDSDVALAEQPTQNNSAPRAAIPA